MLGALAPNDNNGTGYRGRGYATPRRLNFDAVGDAAAGATIRQLLTASATEPPGALTLHQALTSPRRMPPPTSANAHAAYNQFMATQCAAGTTYQEGFDLVIRYFHPIHSFEIPERLAENAALRRRSCIAQHVKYSFNGIVALLVFKTYRGWNLIRNRYNFSLGQMKDKGGEFLRIHNCYVRPIVDFLVTRMNPHGYLNYNDIMSQSVGGYETMQKDRLARGGIWDIESVTPYITPGGVQGINNANSGMTTGVIFNVARILSLVIPEFLTRWNDNTAWHAVLTNAHRDELGENIDTPNGVINRYRVTLDDDW